MVGNDYVEIIFFGFRQYRRLFHSGLLFLLSARGLLCRHNTDVWGIFLFRFRTKIMEKLGGSCRCLKTKKECVACIPGQALDLDAALQELGTLNGIPDKQANGLRERRQHESKIVCFEQSPPLWINSSTSISSNGVVGFPLRVDIEHPKDPPLQPPNSPVSPKLPFEQFRLR